MRDRPLWWDFPIVLSPHVIERMQERDFTEVDLRAMLEDASHTRASIMPGRFIIATHHAGKPWEIVVEPDERERILIVVTAYGVESDR